MGHEIVVQELANFSKWLTQILSLNDLLSGIIGHVVQTHNPICLKTLLLNSASITLAAPARRVFASPTWLPT
ncbi:hypothetical protein B9K09_11135 [Pseudomonas sp. M30-35]|nr:hypothetical protein B9K09_11135 [Pseudomonas sp. M30-35]